MKFVSSALSIFKIGSRETHFVSGACVRSLFAVFLGLALLRCSNSSSSGSDSGTSLSGLSFCYAPKKASLPPACDCYPAEQDRSAAEYNKVSSCGGDPDESCFADLRTSGQANSCECFAIKCWKDDSGYCECNESHLGTLDASTAVEIPSCSPTSDPPNCCITTDGQACGCQGGFCSGNPHSIDSCATSKLSAIRDSRTPVPRCR